MFDLFRMADSEAFGRELAQFVLAELQSGMHQRDDKFRKKAERTLIRAARRLQDYKARHKLNFLSKAKLSNTFLWTLKDGNCPADYADEITEWLTLRL